MRERHSVRRHRSPRGGDQRRSLSRSRSRSRASGPGQRRDRIGDITSPSSKSLAFTTGLGCTFDSGELDAGGGDSRMERGARGGLLRVAIVEGPGPGIGRSSRTGVGGPRRRIGDRGLRGLRGLWLERCEGTVTFHHHDSDHLSSYRDPDPAHASDPCRSSRDHGRKSRLGRRDTARTTFPSLCQSHARALFARGHTSPNPSCHRACRCTGGTETESAYALGHVGLRIGTQTLEKAPRGVVLATDGTGVSTMNPIDQLRCLA